MHCVLFSCIHFYLIKNSDLLYTHIHYWTQRVQQHVIKCKFIYFEYIEKLHNFEDFFDNFIIISNLKTSFFCIFRWSCRGKSALTFILSLGAIIHIIANICFTIFLLLIAGVNYPGGTAISRFALLIILILFF